MPRYRRVLLVLTDTDFDVRAASPGRECTVVLSGPLTRGNGLVRRSVRRLLHAHRTYHPALRDGAGGGGR